MNRALVITRYSRALVKYVRDTGHGEIVCSQAEVLVHALHDIPDLRRMVEADPGVVSAFDKKKLLQTALSEPISPELSRFLSLLNKNGRMDMVYDILRDFIDMYHRSVGVRKARLTTAVEPSERLLRRLKDLVRQKTGDDVIIEADVNPALIGGFVLDIDDYLMDASIKHQLDRIREQFEQKNRRII